MMFKHEPRPYPLTDEQYEACINPVTPITLTKLGLNQFSEFVHLSLIEDDRVFLANENHGKGAGSSYQMKEKHKLFQKGLEYQLKEL